MPLELGLMFALGLVGSLHCVQMCGPIVLAFNLPLKRADALRANLGYNAGRTSLTPCWERWPELWAVASAWWAAWRASRPARASSPALL
jgi:hypothetical protein